MSRKRHWLAVPAFGFAVLAAGEPPPRPSTGNGTADEMAQAERQQLRAGWLDNPRSLTGRALAIWPQQPADAFDTLLDALALSPADPVLLFNAGTAALAADDPRQLRLLQAAAAKAPPALAARAAYNLGTSHLGNGDYGAAAEAYKDALRLQPAFADAKINLEIALRQLSPREASPEQPQQIPQQGEDPSDGGGGSSPPQARSPDGGQTPSPGPRQAPLPGFEDQPELTAEEAAAILEAVENLERQQRSALASEAATKNSSGDKDW